MEDSDTLGKQGLGLLQETANQHGRAPGQYLNAIGNILDQSCFFPVLFLFPSSFVKLVFVTLAYLEASERPPKATHHQGLYLNFTTKGHGPASAGTHPIDR